MKSKEPDFQWLATKWQEWSQNADQSEDGWPSDFPEWSKLINAASLQIVAPNMIEEELRLVEMCWRISEEGEELADYAKANLRACWATIVRLAGSQFPEVRWQVYEVLGEAGNSGDKLLRKGLQDENSYCRRRAILSLARLVPRDSKEIAASFINDSDPYIRQAAIELGSRPAS